MCFIWILCYNFGTNIRFQINPLPYGWLKTLIPYGGEGAIWPPPCFSALRRARDLRFSREGPTDVSITFTLKFIKKKLRAP